jgi:transcriptional regulator with XRE-family HTH domain
MKKISEQLRQAIEESGQSLYAVGKGAGIDNGRLYRFTAGERTLSLDAIDKLGAYLGLELQSIKQTDRKQTPRRRETASR